MDDWLLLPIVTIVVVLAGCTTPIDPSGGPFGADTRTAPENGCPLTPHEGAYPRCVDEDEDGRFERVCEDNIDCYCDTPRSVSDCYPYVLHGRGPVYTFAGETPTRLSPTTQRSKNATDREHDQRR